MTVTQELTATVYDIESDTVLYRLNEIDAQDDLVLHHRRGATIHEYDTTDRNGAPLHVVITVDAPHPDRVADQGAVYEFGGTVTPAVPTPNHTPRPAEPQNTPPAPTGDYADALTVCRTLGAAHAPNDALMASLCQDVIQTLVGAVHPQYVWEGAMKKGLTAKELLHLCRTDVMAVDELQWL
ncbi:hypothetical protein [Streptomyces sp. NPDC088736]|uniref:hypothetical protein n=1 Tax=Streptomyces sp. NPDC088736 TaxID=3365881 RepID=UPI0038124902